MKRLGGFCLILVLLFAGVAQARELKALPAGESGVSAWDLELERRAEAKAAEEAELRAKGLLPQEITEKDNINDEELAENENASPVVEEHNAPQKGTDDIQPQLELSAEKNSEKDVEDETIAPLMSRREIRETKRKTQIAEERAKETNRFKKKAIENTEAREKKYEKIMKRKEEKASRFQKAAWEKAAKEKEEKLAEANQASKSRFTEKAKKKAEERAKKREEKNKRLKRNRKD